jgi:hypothetical protein
VIAWKAWHSQQFPFLSSSPQFPCHQHYYLHFDFSEWDNRYSKYYLLFSTIYSWEIAVSCSCVSVTSTLACVESISCGAMPLLPYSNHQAKSWSACIVIVLVVLLGCFYVAACFFSVLHPSFHCILVYSFLFSFLLRN